MKLMLSLIIESGQYPKSDKNSSALSGQRAPTLAPSPDPWPHLIRTLSVFLCPQLQADHEP